MLSHLSLVRLSDSSMHAFSLPFNATMISSILLVLQITVLALAPACMHMGTYTSYSYSFFILLPQYILGLC
jgi:hypothetical protein